MYPRISLRSIVPRNPLVLLLDLICDPAGGTSFTLQHTKMHSFFRGRFLSFVRPATPTPSLLFDVVILSRENCTYSSARNTTIYLRLAKRISRRAVLEQIQFRCRVNVTSISISFFFFQSLGRNYIYRGVLLVFSLVRNEVAIKLYAGVCLSRARLKSFGLYYLMR